MGMATAAASSVAVMTQEAFAVEVFSSCGSSGWIGITSDCMSAATMPPKHRMITVTSGWFRREPLTARRALLRTNGAGHEDRLSTWGND